MTKKEPLVRLIVFVLLLMSLLAFLGVNSTLSAGFHFVDNHEVIQINKDVSDLNGDVVQVAKNWVKSDLGSRFRPVYIIDNVLLYSFYNANFEYLSIHHAFVIALIAFFLFLSIRKLGYSLLLSIVFPLLILVGSQSAIFWRLGPNESIGMWFLSLSVLSMIYAIKSNKNKIIFRILFCFLGLLMALCKESFLLLIPALLFVYLFLYSRNNANLKLSLSVKKNLPELVFFGLLFVLSVAYVSVKVNTESLGYAGIKDVDFQKYVKAFGTLFLNEGVGVVSLMLFTLSYVVSVSLDKKNKQSSSRTHLYVLILAVLIVVPQVYLYGKSGVFERYFIPGVIAWAILFVFSVKSIKQVLSTLDNHRYSVSFSVFSGILLLSIFIPKLISVTTSARNFTKECQQVNSVLSVITENINSSDSVLFIAEPVSDFERTASFRRYLNGVSNVEHIYTKPVQTDVIDDFGRSLINSFSWVMGGEQNHFDKLEKINDVKLIVCFPYWRSKSDSIVRSIGYRTEDFLQFKVGEYQLYFLNKKQNPEELFRAEALAPNDTLANKNSVYNEVSFYPQHKIMKGDSVFVTVRPFTEITDQMVAFIILLDESKPDNILIHDQIHGNGSVDFSFVASTSVAKPWLIYRNWGNVAPIPVAQIAYKVKPKQFVNIPVR